MHVRAFTPLSLTLIAATSFIQADYDDAQNCIINPPARPPTNECFNLFFTGDFLWWEAHENGLDYLVKNEEGTAFINSGKVTEPKFEWDPGFRVGLGYNMAHDGWDVYANWTRFHTTTGDDRTHRPVGGLLEPTFLDPSFDDLPITLGQLFNEARSRWKLHLNQIDLTLGREFFVSRWLTLRPHLGLRAAWIRQKYTIHYLGTLTESVPSLDLPVGASTDNLVDMRNNYTGFGLLGGLNTQWGLGGGWSLYGDLDLSLLYGFFRVTHKEEEDISHTAKMHIRNRFHLSRVVADLAAGLRWQRSFGCDDDLAILIQLGWEHHVYFGQNQFMRFTNAFMPGQSVSNLGDLTLQGWTLAFKFDF